MTKREWLSIPAMLVGAAAPVAVLGLISLSTWSGILAGVLTVPCAVLAAILVVEA